MPPRRNKTGKRKATDSMLIVDHLSVRLDSEVLSIPNTNLATDPGASSFQQQSSSSKAQHPSTQFLELNSTNSSISPLAIQTTLESITTELPSSLATLPTTSARAWDISENGRVRTKSKF